MQKSYQAHARATLFGWTQTHIVDDRGEGRTYNSGLAKVAVPCSAETFMVN